MKRAEARFILASNSCDVAELHEKIAPRIYYYNHQRIHAALGMSPAAYAASLMLSAALKRKDKVLQKVRG